MAWIIGYWIGGWTRGGSLKWWRGDLAVHKERHGYLMKIFIPFFPLFRFTAHLYFSVWRERRTSSRNALASIKRRASWLPRRNKPSRSTPTFNQEELHGILLTEWCLPTCFTGPKLIIALLPNVGVIYILLSLLTNPLNTSCNIRQRISIPVVYYCWFLKCCISDIFHRASRAR